MSRSTSEPSSPLSLEPTAAQLERIATGSSVEFDAILAKWKPEIEKIARSHVGRRSDLDDLRQAGRLALHGAALKYDADRGPFSHFARRVIKRRVQGEAARLDGQRYGEVAIADNPLAIEAMTDCSRTAAVEVTDALALFPLSHREVYRLLYIEGMTQRRAAHRLGVSQPRVAQLHRMLLDASRRLLRESA